MSYRLFVAITIPEPVKARLASLKTDIPGAVWVKPYAFHLTLRFIGDDIAPEQIPAIRSALATVREEPFAVSLTGIGRFPPQPNQPPRVLWVGVDAPPALRNLHISIERALAAAHFPPERHPFNPHITIARLKSFRTPPQVETFLQQHRAFSAGIVPAQAFHLISSTLQRDGPLYQTIETFPLG